MTARRRTIAAAAVLALAMGAGAGFWAFDRWQRAEIFAPSVRFAQVPADLALRYDTVWIASPPAGGVEAGRVNGWWLPGPGADAPAVLYLHGNDDTISTTLEASKRLHDAGFAVLAIDYRGFGKSTAALPEERSAYADAQAAWGRLRELAPRASRFVVYGHSLGSAIAVELARREPAVGGLMVEGGFTSMQALIATTEFGWLPLSLVLTQRFASDEKVGALAMPKLFIHCDKDEVIDAAFGRRLFDAAAAPKVRLAIPGGNHSHCPDADQAGWRQAVQRIGGMPAAAAAAPLALTNQTDK